LPALRDQRHHGHAGGRNERQVGPAVLMRMRRLPKDVDAMRFNSFVVASILFVLLSGCAAQSSSVVVHSSSLQAEGHGCCDGDEAVERCNRRARSEGVLLPGFRFPDSKMNRAAGRAKGPPISSP
jgi:hypothetical protein